MGKWLLGYDRWTAEDCGFDWHNGEWRRGHELGGGGAWRLHPVSIHWQRVESMKCIVTMLVRISRQLLVGMIPAAWLHWCSKFLVQKPKAQVSVHAENHSLHQKWLLATREWLTRPVNLCFTKVFCPIQKATMPSPFVSMCRVNVGQTELNRTEPGWAGPLHHAMTAHTVWLGWIV